MVVCPLCKGAGRLREDDPDDCFVCRGRGAVTEEEEDEFMTEDGM